MDKFAHYKVGTVYTRNLDKTDWKLVTWGDVSVCLASTKNPDEKIYPAHEQFRREFK